jgi:NADP-dependent aldehyde dehydrogenase
MNTSHLSSFDPRTGLPVGPGLRPTSPDELEQMLAAASAARRLLRHTARPARVAMLRSIAMALAQSSDHLVSIADRETGLGRERLSGEVKRTIGQLELFAERLSTDPQVDEAFDPGGPSQASLRREGVPVGTVLIFGASNFPFAFSVLGGDTVSALAAGCPVLVKAHEAHLQLSQETARLAREAIDASGLPAGTFQLIVGQDAAQRALLDARVKAAGFTGSTRAGRLLFDLAVQRPEPIPFYGELGGVNPVVVTGEALTRRGEEILDGFVASFTLGNGQFCTKPGLLIVPSGVDVESGLRERLSGLTRQPMLSAGIASAYYQGVRSLSLADGVHAVVIPEPESDEGYWARPALVSTDLSSLRASRQLLLEECFGPCAVVVRYENGRELADLVDLLPGCLVAGVHAEQEELEGLGWLVDSLEERAGRLVLNGWPTGVAVSPAMQHGGPWPATTYARFTSVGTAAIERWLRPVAYQGFPGREKSPGPKVAPA